ncbi:MAG: acylphosphatase [Phycisphaerae bacterium]
MAEPRELHRERFIVTGQVQGVGFRPFVYRLAAELSLTGWVVNDAGGVTIEVQGAPTDVGGFGERLRAYLPPLARIATCRQMDAELSRQAPIAWSRLYEMS